MKKEKWQKLPFDKLTPATGWKSGTGWKSEGDFIGTDEEDTQTQTVAYLSNHRNNSQRTERERQANGRLIAAAPNLLAAAIKLIDRLEDYDEISSESSTLWRGCDEWDEITALKKAINKAL